MDNVIFLARLNTMLSRHRSKILGQELEADFPILRRQREGESVPPKLYWALKSFPKEYQASYTKCLADGNDDNAVKEKVLSRERQTAKLVLMEWAERPSMDAPTELKKWHDAAVEYDKKIGYYAGQIKSLCKKDVVGDAFRDRYQRVTGHKMRRVGDSVFVDRNSIVIGDARVIVGWDCGGWSHFREEIGVEWQGRITFLQQSICSWLGYFPTGAGGWNWILKDDLETAAEDAVQQTILFRDILVEAVRKALE